MKALVSLSPMIFFLALSKKPAQKSKALINKPMTMTTTIQKTSNIASCNVNETCKQVGVLCPVNQCSYIRVNETCKLSIKNDIFIYMYIYITSIIITAQNGQGTELF